MKDRDQKAYPVKLGPLVICALHHLLAETRVKKRGEMRLHSSVFKQLKKRCMKMVDPFRGTFNDEGGEIELTLTQAKFLKDIYEVLCKGAGFPGSMSEGAGDLLDLIEDVESFYVADQKKEATDGEAAT